MIPLGGMCVARPPASRGGRVSFTGTGIGTGIGVRVMGPKDVGIASDASRSTEAAIGLAAAYLAPSLSLETTDADRSRRA